MEGDLINHETDENNICNAANFGYCALFDLVGFALFNCPVIQIGSLYHLKRLLVLLQLHTLNYSGLNFPQV